MATKTKTKSIPKKWQKLINLLPGYDVIETAKDCWFDTKIAKLYIDYIEQCCTHIEGELAGKPFILENWEKAIVANLFGWQKIDAYGRQIRRFREMLLYVARKQGKTPLAAALMNAVFFLDEEQGQQNYCAAGERDQATLLFRHISGMIHNEPEMNSRIQEYIASKTIVRHSDQSFIKVLSAEADTKHGGNPHVVAVDELHVQKKRDLIDVFQTAMASKNRKQPLLIFLTTADYIHESICNEKYDYACNVRDGIIDDETFLPVIYEADRDGNWKSEKQWRKANPNLGVSVSLDFMKRECKRAQEIPTYENTFKRLHLNIRTEQDVRWISLDLWNQNDFAIYEEDLIGKRCFVGFDLSTNTDVAGYAMLFPPQDEIEKWTVIPRFFLPRDNAIKRERRDKVPYIVWSRDDYITLTDGNVVDYDVIRASFIEDSSKFDMVEIAFDRWGFEALRQRFIYEGIPEDNFVSFGQGFASMSQPSKEFEKLLMAKEIAHGGHPVLSWMASNVSAEIDPAGNIKPSKKTSTGRIDGIVMIIMALGRAMQTPEPTESVYESRGIMVL